MLRDLRGLEGKAFQGRKDDARRERPADAPFCRCSTAAYSDRKEYEEWLDFLEKGGTTEEYNKSRAVEQKINTSLTNKAGIGGIIQSGASHGAWTDKSDPENKKRRKIAEDYYEQVRNRNREFEIKTVAKNSGLPEKDVDKIFAHIFELEHAFKDGTIHRFHPDYYMQHSWMRLQEGKNIQPHDMILLLHELEEAKIMGTGLDVVYEEAHAVVEKRYNYTEALLEYLKDHDV